MATKKEPKPKQKTRDQLVRENGSLQTEVDLLKGSLSRTRLDFECEKGIGMKLRGIIAELEREKAMLQGYIERDLQDKRDAALYREGNKPVNAPACDAGFTQHVGEITPYSMPILLGSAAHITQKGSYGSRDEVKKWYEL